MLHSRTLLWIPMGAWLIAVSSPYSGESVMERSKLLQVSATVQLFTSQGH